MSRIARCLCATLLLANTAVTSPVNNSYAVNVTSNEITREAKEELETSEKETTLKYGQVVGVGDSNLRIRKEPSLEAEVEYGLFNGITFDILDKVGDWYKINHFGTIGYVHKDYVVEFDEVPPYEIYKAVEETVSSTRAIEAIPVEETEEVFEPHGRAITVELTAYCNCHYCTGSGQGITAMGTTTRVGVIAVPQSISLGSRLYIPGLTHYKSDGIFHAEDRGGAIQMKADGTYIVDLWMPTHEQALQFGRQTMTAYIMD